jgi:hypothetical protein
MGKISDARDQVVQAITDLPEFSGLSEHIHATRPFEPENAQDQAKTKAYGLGVFISVERVKTSSADAFHIKTVSVIVDLWINTHNSADAGNGALDLWEAIIKACEALPQADGIHLCAEDSRIEDSYRVDDAPKPNIVYRVITNLKTIIN